MLTAQLLPRGVRCTSGCLLSCSETWARQMRNRTGIRSRHLLARGVSGHHAVPRPMDRSSLESVPDGEELLLGHLTWDPAPHWNNPSGSNPGSCPAPWCLPSSPRASGQPDSHSLCPVPSPRALRVCVPRKHPQTSVLMPPGPSPCLALGSLCLGHVHRAPVPVSSSGPARLGQHIHPPSLWPSVSSHEDPFSCHASPLPPVLLRAILPP